LECIGLKPRWRAREADVKRSCVLLACLMLPLDAGAQATPPTFRSGVDIVGLNVVVTDGEQKFVTGLTAEDFTVYEDGVQQDVSFFASTAVPLDLAVLLDTSASMSDKMETVQEAAIGFTRTLRSGDRLIVVDIKDATRILHPLDADPSASSEAILSTVARGGTALYNGLYMTIKELVKQRRTNGEVRRQAIAVLSDGQDTASLVGFDEVMAAAKEAGISIYTITLRSAYRIRAFAEGGSRFSDSEFSMKLLAQETGARSFFPRSITELTGVYGSIAEELSNQYALGYSSKNPKHDGGFRRVIVRVASRPGVHIRTRSGYQSPRPQRALSTH
jgi:Ca-activated chloride channel family protein